MKIVTRKKSILSRLSSNAKISIRNASIIAENLSKRTVQPEHLLVGILLNQESLAHRILQTMGFNSQEVFKKLLGSVSVDITTDTDKPREVVLSKETQEIIRKAYDWSLKFSHVYVGTEHILLSILDSKDPFIKDLEKYGLDVRRFQKYLFETATYPLGVLAKPVRQDPFEGENILSILGEDLVQLAKDGQLDPVIGREEELNNLIRILSRRKKNNPIVIGEAGVGKTVLVEGLAQKIADGRVPPSLRDMKIVSLDVASIMAGSKMRGDVEEKVLDIVNSVVESNDTILFIDEIHTVLSSGMQGGTSEIASILKPALVRDGFRCIGATTTEEYSAYFEEDNALARRFQPVVLKESSIEDTVKILANLKPILEAHHNMNISEDALELAVSLSDRYISDRYLPDKAIDLLDEAAATKRLEIEGSFQNLSTLISKQRSLGSAKEEYVLKGQMEKAESIQKRENVLLKKIEKLQQEVDASKKNKDSEVGIEDVRKVVSMWTGIPLNTLGEKEKNALLKLENRISKKVLGQEEAVSAVANAIKRARIGISDISRPWASFLFLGPTGVGKTELAKELATELFGDSDRLIQIDMSEMMEMHSVSKLIGSPPGYIGYREGGRLTEQVKRNPHSVVLFDEIEKAHPDVLNILLQILEDGHLTDGRGKKVNFKNTIIVLTSNIGAEEISKDKVLGFSETTGHPAKASEQAYNSMRSELLSQLRNTLRPELLNRLDDIVIFKSLTTKDARKIVDLLLQELNKRLVEKNVKVLLSPSLVKHIVAEGFSEEYGARPLRRELQDLVEGALANYLLKGGSAKSVVLEYVKNKVVIKEK